MTGIFSEMALNLAYKDASWVAIPTGAHKAGIMRFLRRE